MIETPVDQILTLVREGKILSESAFASVSLSKALEIREGDHRFRYYQDDPIRSRWNILPLDSDIRGVFDALHELTYTIAKERIKKLTDNDDDTTHLVLSDHITHEIDWIAMSRATEYYTDWYDELWASYLRDEIPMSTAEPFVRPLIERKNASNKTIPPNEVNWI